MDAAIPPHSDCAWGSAPRVLVVDDQPDFREAARLLLERRGYAVAGEAGCAATALDTVERLAPEAVLLDVRLGGDDGFDVCPCADVRATRARGAPHLDLRRPTRVVARRLTALGAARAASRTRPLGPCLSRRGCPAPPPQATRRRDARMPRGDPHAEGRRSDRKAQQRVEIDGLAVDSRVHRRGGAYLQRRCAPRSDGRVRAVPARDRGRSVHPSCLATSNRPSRPA